MGEIISFMTKGYTIIDVLMIISFFVAVVICIERFLKWCAKHLKNYYDKKKGIEDKDNILNTHSKEIAEIAGQITTMIAEINDKHNLLIEKINDQEKKLNAIDNAGKQRDRALLRDRIIGGMRYYSQNVDDNGNVHISLTDHENMTELFKEYFSCGGNGTIQQMYEKEFSNWIIN